jgi:hypothetical protein
MLGYFTMMRFYANALGYDVWEFGPIGKHEWRT